MIILVSGATRAVALRPVEHVGILASALRDPLPNVIVTTGRVWAADNDCFTGFNQKRFVRLLDRIGQVDKSRLKFVALPDVVGSHSETMVLFRPWIPELERRGLPAAFVCQDGATVEVVPWGSIAAVFIGGTTRWKLGAESEKIIDTAKARGLWVHVGRVRTPGRIKNCAAMGVDSIDGSAFSRWPDDTLDEAIEIIRKEPRYLWSQ